VKADFLKETKNKKKSKMGNLLYSMKKPTGKPVVMANELGI